MASGNVAEFVSAHQRAKKIREDARETRRTLTSEYNEARDVFIELMLAAGLTSYRISQQEYIVLKRKDTMLKMNAEVVEDLLTKMTENDLRICLSSNGDPTNNNLLKAVRLYARRKLSSGCENDEDDDASSYSIKYQYHAPLDYESPRGQVMSTLEGAAERFKAADISKKSFNGRIKDLLDSVTSGVDEAVEMAVVDFVVGNGVSSSASTGDQAEKGDQSGRTNRIDQVHYRQVPSLILDAPSRQSDCSNESNGSNGSNESNGNDGSDEERRNTTSSLAPTAATTATDRKGKPLFLRVDKKCIKPRKVSKKKFIEIVDGAIEEVLSRRFGSSSTITLAKLREISSHTHEVGHNICQQLEALSTIPDGIGGVGMTHSSSSSSSSAFSPSFSSGIITSVSLTTKKPRH